MVTKVLFIIGLKYVDNCSKLKDAARKAITQMEVNQYWKRLQQYAVTDIKLYGIAFYKKWSRAHLSHIIASKNTFTFQIFH
jgi:hypothetical protein